MTSTPFPSFTHSLSTSESSSSLAAVGTCRIVVGRQHDDFAKIVAKNKEQALESDKTLKKKYMKQGVAMAQEYLSKVLDVSVVNVQISLQDEHVVDTDGCLCACLLDAGCDKIVLQGNALQAMEISKIPRERLVAAFDCTAKQLDESAVQAALQYCSTISVAVSASSSTKETTLQLVDKVLAVVPDAHDKVIFELDTNSVSLQDLTSLVSEISKRLKDYKGQIALQDPTAEQLGKSYAACCQTDRPDGLFTTVVCTRSGEALGLVYSSTESIVAALQCGRGVYYSRSRAGLWRKGDTSGHYQTLHRIDVDCDGDALRFTVTQRGDDVAAFCHLNTLTCWGEPCGLRHLEGTLQERLKSAPEGSYTKRLFDDEQLLRDKLVEEAQELSEATEPSDVAGELADVLYFAMVRAVKAGVSIDDAVAVLDKRTRKVTRRKGDSKAFRIAAGNEILSSSKSGGDGNGNGGATDN